MHPSEICISNGYKAGGFAPLQPPNSKKEGVVGETKVSLLFDSVREFEYEEEVPLAEGDVGVSSGEEFGGGGAEEVVPQLDVEFFHAGGDEDVLRPVACGIVCGQDGGLGGSSSGEVLDGFNADDAYDGTAIWVGCYGRETVGEDETGEGGGVVVVCCGGGWLSEELVSDAAGAIPVVLAGKKGVPVDEEACVR